jgi:hypothetical protein
LVLPLTGRIKHVRFPTVTLREGYGVATERSSVRRRPGRILPRPEHTGNGSHDREDTYVNRW